LIRDFWIERSASDCQPHRLAMEQSKPVVTGTASWLCQFCDWSFGKRSFRLLIAVTIKLQFSESLICGIQGMETPADRHLWPIKSLI